MIVYSSAYLGTEDEVGLQIFFPGARVRRIWGLRRRWISNSAPNWHTEPIFGRNTSNDHTKLLTKEKITFYILKVWYRVSKKADFSFFKQKYKVLQSKILQLKKRRNSIQVMINNFCKKAKKELSLSTNTGCSEKKKLKIILFFFWSKNKC